MDEQFEVSSDDLKAAFRTVTDLSVDRRLEAVMNGEEEWPALQRYVDERIRVYFESQEDNPAKKADV